MKDLEDLILHPATRRQLADFTAAPSHAVLLVGPTGSGKQTLAASLSATVLKLPPGGFASYPYKVIITAEAGKSIGIEAVRQLEHFLSLKVPGQAGHNRAVIINNAQLLSLEAQNALLKTLEEPPRGTFIILTLNNEQAVLPTIRSRAQSIIVKRPERAAVADHFQRHNFDAQAIDQAYAISGGLPGLMHALLEETDHPLKLATERARQLLSQSAYERLLTIDELAKQRQLALDTTFILQQMAHVSLQTSSPAAAAKWQAVLKASYQAAEALASSAQPKLVLTNLALSF
jgi:energy-coupling factor transporter ATP-binding protein EcfA2